MNATPDPPAELEALARFYRVNGPTFAGLSRALRPWLARYCEIAVGERGFEVIAGSPGGRGAEELARIARRFGLSAPAADAFLAGARAYPGRMLGLKVVAGRAADGPTLYVRSLAPRDEVLALLGGQGFGGGGLAELRERLRGTHVLYGVGFFSRGDAAGVKTYTVADLGGAWEERLARDWPAGAGLRLPHTGFVSYRLLGRRLTGEVKVYLPELAWDEIPEAGPRWAGLLRFAAAELGYHTAGHLGLTLRPGRAPQMKLYVERVGAIPNDFSAR